MSKNIVIFPDGTGQDGGVGYDSNVYKLFKAVENRTNSQIAFYDRGLGTGWRRLTGQATGAGISQNILECYQFIFENYEAGDQIFLFGFSRGAATVRSLSSFIENFGVLPISRPELIKRAYKIYKIRETDARNDAIFKFHEKHHTMWTKVKFLGVWDTVAALGVPIPFLDRIVDRIPLFKHKFHNFDLSPSVKNAYHALSIDEKRKTFLPVIWNAQVAKGQHVEQVWFAGVHSDIGGGYEDTGLSDIAFHWMIKNAVDHGLRIHNGDILKFEGNPMGPLHVSRTGLFRYLAKKERFWTKLDPNGDRRGNPNIHPSVSIRAADRKGILTEKYQPWILNI